MKIKSILTITSLLAVSFGLSSCNSISLAIKNKGEEVQFADWADGYMESYSKNLGDFCEKVFYSSPVFGEKKDIASSYTIKTRDHENTTKVAHSIEENNTLKIKYNNETLSVVTFDFESNVYKTKTTSSRSEKTPQNSYTSSQENTIQYQRFQNNVYAFDLVNKIYSRKDNINTVQSVASSDVTLQSIYFRIRNIYESLKISSKVAWNNNNNNTKFYMKGNVFTITYSEDFNGEEIYEYSGSDYSGSVSYTEQYILEKSYITLTSLTEFKKCSWKDEKKEYAYTLNSESGFTTTMKLKGTLSKVYAEDFTFRSN